MLRRSMRALLLVAFGACTADIAPETYFCGPERLCPEGLACNDADNICTVPSAVGEFGCGEVDGVPIPDFQDDDTPGQGLDVSPTGSCFSTRELRACLFEDDPGDWFQFDLPSDCGATVKMTGRVSFAVAFEPIAVQVAVDDLAPQTVDVECPSTSDEAGQTQRCFETSLTSDSHYAVGLVHSGLANCDGTCSHNRYILTLRLEAR